MTGKLTGDLSLETRRRVVELLEILARQQLTSADLQATRGVEVLERIGSDDARQWLTTLSQGDPIACATREATAALKRMGRK